MSVLQEDRITTNANHNLFTYWSSAAAAAAAGGAADCSHANTLVALRRHTINHCHTFSGT